MLFFIKYSVHLLTSYSLVDTVYVSSCIFTLFYIKLLQTSRNFCAFEYRCKLFSSWPLGTIYDELISESELLNENGRSNRKVCFASRSYSADRTELGKIVAYSAVFLPFASVRFHFVLLIVLLNEPLSVLELPGTV